MRYFENNRFRCIITTYMGKKKMAVLGTEDESASKAKAGVKREQKKMRASAGSASSKKDEPNVEAILGGITESTLAAQEEKKSVKKVHVRSKNYKTLKAMVDVTKTYDLSDAIKLLREVSKVSFDPSVELHITLIEKSASKEIDLPHTNGKTRRIAVATDETIEKITKNIIDFDVLLASPDQMGKLVRFAKTLGPKGLMPNPKNGTVVPDPEKTAKAMAGKISVTLKTEKDAPLIHTTVGKLSMSDKDLTENITAITSPYVGKFTKIVLKSSMSPAIKLSI